MAVILPPPLPVAAPPVGEGLRQAAAEGLRQGIAESRALRSEGSPALAPLIRRALHAGEELEGSHLVGRLDRLVDHARWRAVLDPVAAAARLESDLASLADDLEFEPILEAELPVGFPAPTPVGEIELKRFPGYRMARADTTGGASMGAFWKLFNHIRSNEIAMTAPVEMSFETGSDGLQETSMAFLYGRPDLGRAGSDAEVEVVDVDAARFASLGCRGRTSSEQVERAREQLTRWIAARPGLSVSGEPRVMSYNSPRVPSSRSYFEVQIPVRDNRRTIIDFSDPAEVDRWGAIDDVVMGGRSESALARSASGEAAFTGRVSLENDGGFASIRSRPLRTGFGDATAIVLRCRGDGKTYKLRLQTRALGQEALYQASFATTRDEVTEHRFESSDFTAVWRGRVVHDAPELRLGDVESLGFLISDEQAGPFRIELGSIERE